MIPFLSLFQCLVKLYPSFLISNNNRVPCLYARVKRIRYHAILKDLLSFLGARERAKRIRPGRRHQTTRLETHWCESQVCKRYIQNEDKEPCRPKTNQPTSSINHKKRPHHHFGEEKKHGTKRARSPGHKLSIIQPFPESVVTFSQ